MSKQVELGQYMTPDWVSVELVDRYFPREEGYIEPSCGRGSFLRAFSSAIPAIGVEIDPDMARVARESSGRSVIVGDFRAVDLSIRATAIVGNPPFKQSTVLGFLDRAWELLPDEGRVGFILPCYILQTASTVTTLSERWSVRQDLLPRNIKSVWAAVTRAALEALGGAGTLDQIYREVEGHRPTANRFWQSKIRQTLQIIAVSNRRGYWALPQPSLFDTQAIAA